MTIPKKKMRRQSPNQILHDLISSGQISEEELYRIMLLDPDAPMSKKDQELFDKLKEAFDGAIEDEDDIAYNITAETGLKPGAPEVNSPERTTVYYEDYYRYLATNAINMSLLCNIPTVVIGSRTGGVTVIMNNITFERLQSTVMDPAFDFVAYSDGNHATVLKAIDKF